MKHLLTILISVFILTLFFAGLPVKFVRSCPKKDAMMGYQLFEGAKNWALLSQVILDEYGDRGVCRLLYSMRDWQNGIRALIMHFNLDSTFIFKKEDIVLSKLNGYTERVSECINDAHFVEVIREAIMRKTNDTIFFYCEETPVISFFGILKRGSKISQTAGLLRPRNLRDSIQDTTAWEQAALQDIKEMIRFYKNHPVKVIQPPKDIPDSMKNIYNLYMNNTL